MPVKQKFNTSEKMYDNLVNFGSFLWKFAIILADFCYSDPFHESNPDPAGRNEIDPNGSGSETLLKSKQKQKT